MNKNSYSMYRIVRNSTAQTNPEEVLWFTAFVNNLNCVRILFLKRERQKRNNNRWFFTSDLHRKYHWQFLEPKVHHPYELNFLSKHKRCR